MNPKQKNTGLKGMGRKREYFYSNQVVITVSNAHPVKDKVKIVAQELRDRVNKMNDKGSVFLKDMIRLGRFEIYIKLLRVVKGTKQTDFFYHVNSIVREQKNC